MSTGASGATAAECATLMAANTQQIHGQRSRPHYPRLRRNLFFLLRPHRLAQSSESVVIPPWLCIACRASLSGASYSHFSGRRIHHTRAGDDCHEALSFCWLDAYRYIRWPSTFTLAMAPTIRAASSATSSAFSKPHCDDLDRLGCGNFVLRFCARRILTTPNSGARIGPKLDAFNRLDTGSICAFAVRHEAYLKSLPF